MVGGFVRLTERTLLSDVRQTLPGFVVWKTTGAEYMRRNPTSKCAGVNPLGRVKKELFQKANDKA